jgi:HK97 family phage major capsid protein
MSIETWREKQQRAAEIIERVKADWKVIQSAEDAQKCQRMVTDARKLMAEAGEEKRDIEKARLNEILEEFDRDKEQQAAKARDVASWHMERPTTRPFAQGSDAALQGSLFDRMKSDAVRMMVSDRMIREIPDLQKAALGEASGSTGGYLVVPAYLQDLFAEVRRQGNALRSYGWLNIHPVETNQIYLPKGSGAASVAWVPENTQKPSTDQTYVQVSVAINTLAGISKQSKQLAMDSSPTVLDLSTRELGSLLGNAEETAILNGSGTGQPLGILQTTGLAQTPATSDTAPGAVVATATQQTVVIDAILSAVVAVETNFFAPPTGCLMHPRRMAWLLKGKDSQGNYLFNRQGTFRQPNMDPQMRTVTSVSTGLNTPPYDLFGLPIGTSTNIPTNLNYGASGASDQDVIIVAAWDEAHVFQRQDVTMDTSDVAGSSWENNQVWIRGEERLGFSCARYPTAFACVYGKGLNGTTNV